MQTGKYALTPLSPGRYGESARYVGRNTEGRFAHADRKAVSQRSGARDLPSGGRADGGK